MATKKSPSSTIAEIEKNIAVLSAQLYKARTQKVTDNEKALKLATAAVAVAATKVRQLEAKKTPKTELKKAKVELANLQQHAVSTEAELRAATTALEMAKETAKLLIQPALNPAQTAVKKPKATAKTAKKIAVEAQTKNNQTTQSATTTAGNNKATAATPHPVAKTALPKAKPLLREVIGTAVTIPPAPESSVLPEHGTTKMIEPRDNPLPKPTPV